jgi:hypothetical protein
MINGFGAALEVSHFTCSTLNIGLQPDSHALCSATDRGETYRLCVLSTFERGHRFHIDRYAIQNHQRIHLKYSTIFHDQP